ncbi:hypothetical protein TRQ7_01610 [Thermotoga sp. RQ7]|uniref:sulfatase-like hydrolase/transferase n=1 Tax=Thermotoga sp. RQ7 TaxID=126738 RepID=UPI0005A3504B|nr:sulfatase-like hydrolase/transferase [Thermotoga sp. RQ7]AJG40170.1 hypothetical protein TRQ7_01610 [Thermotoga sp. RQ7]
MSEKLNVFIIITDCLRYDAFQGMKIKKYAEKSGLVLENVFSAAPSTFFAVPSILTGTLPFQVIKDAKISKEAYTYLPFVAHKHGYQSIFITANVVTSRAYGYYIKEGIFEDFLNTRKLPPTDFGYQKPENAIKKAIKTILRKNDHLFYSTKKIYNKIKFLLTQGPKNQNTLFENKIRSDMIIDYLSQLQLSSTKPAFGFIHLMDTHAPYGSPKLSPRELKNASKLVRKLYTSPDILKEKEIELLKYFYQTEVEYLDSSLGDLLDLIDRKFNLDKTLVIVLSDHGEAFGEKGVLTHPGDGLIEEVLRIPLFMVGKIDDIRITGEGVLPSWKIHELVLKVFLGQEVPQIGYQDEAIAIGYRKESGKYKIVRFAEINHEKIVLSEDLNYLNEILVRLRRKYIVNKMKIFKQ